MGLAIAVTGAMAVAVGFIVFVGSTSGCTIRLTISRLIVGDYEMRQRLPLRGGRFPLLGTGPAAQ